MSIRRSTIFTPTLVDGILVPNDYREAPRLFACERCGGQDMVYNPHIPWCGICDHPVRKYALGDRGKRFGKHYCDVVASCHGEVDVLRIEWEHGSINVDHPERDGDFCKRLNGETFFLKGGDRTIQSTGAAKAD